MGPASDGDARIRSSPERSPTRIRTSTTITAPAGAVWARLADIADHPRWMADAESVEFLGARRRGVGTRMVVVTSVGPFRTRDVMEVTEWKEGLVMGVRHVGVVRGEGRFTLRPAEAGTEVVWEEDLAFPRYLGGALTAALAAPVLTRLWRANLARLRLLIEGG